jgi:hypothetical protein
VGKYFVLWNTRRKQVIEQIEDKIFWNRGKEFKKADFNPQDFQSYQISIVRGENSIFLYNVIN